MRIKCDYCGSMIDETSTKCEHCGAPNEKLKRVGEGVPKTIDELKTWYTSHNLPEPEITRFFIGEDYKNPRAFGIYKDDNGKFIVYKNKDDGTRAIRYEGTDEVYAVNELYLKLKEEIQNQKNHNNHNNRNNNSLSIMKKVIKSYIILVLGIIILSFIILIIGAFASKENGYYNYNDTEYYKHNSH